MEGGSVYDHAAMVRVLDRAGCEVRIEGEVRSSATMFLAVGCVVPEARLVFHLPTPDEHRHRAEMARHYPPAIADWFTSLPSGTPPLTMMGAEAIRLGATAC